MAKLLLKNLIDAGCRPRKSVDPKRVSYPFSTFGSHCVEQILEFYSLCDGGPLSRLNCEFLSLQEATRVWDSYSMLEWRCFPFFWDNEHHSDPVLLGIDGPIQGYVLQSQHDGRWRILARGLRSFVRSLARFKDIERFFVEAHDFDYPRTLDEEDIIAFTGMIELSYRTQARWFLGSLFTELALSMVQGDQLIELLPPLRHPNSNSRHMIEKRLNELGAKAKRLSKIVCNPKK